MRWRSLTMDLRMNAVALMIMATGLLLNGPAQAEEAVNAKTIAERMDKSKYAAAEIKSYLKDLKKRTVIAEGKIKDILSGKTGNRIVLSVNAGKSNDFIVDVYVDQTDKFRKGDQLSCRGEYAKYNAFTVNGITLKNGNCSKK